MKHIFIGVLFILEPRPLAIESLPRTYIWNVGQGQWATRVSWSQCHHFDVGGEYPPQNIQSLCAEKKNYVWLSHWDQDHLNLLHQIMAFASVLCLYDWPLGKGSWKKEKLLAKLPLCNTPWPESVQRWTPSSLSLKLKSNDLSRVIVWQDWLIPGDSTQRQEKFWIHRLNIKQIKFILLGHHGSSTSTSEALLDSLPQLQMAFASARKKKYGHPHAAIVQRLIQHGIPTLSTEDWGTICVETPW